jgi:hypothetical protein
MKVVDGGRVMIIFLKYGKNNNTVTKTPNISLYLYTVLAVFFRHVSPVHFFTR